MTGATRIAMSVVVVAAWALSANAAGPSSQPARDLTLDLGNDVSMKLVLIPAGRFVMGSPATGRGRDVNEAQREVTIAKPFYMGVHEVTVDQYARFVKDTGQRYEPPGFKQTGDHPAVDISWDTAQLFCAWLSKRTGKTVQLPTEAQWEYACRAGTKTRYSFGDRDADLGDYAWYSENTRDDPKSAKTHAVGQKKPNPWGLYDMHGSVWEWCMDRYMDPDPGGVRPGTCRVLRGGTWSLPGKYCRSACRTMGHPEERSSCICGIRVVVAAGAD
jgi:formylglycine-generating enzyme required for sulfatase activity